MKSLETAILLVVALSYTSGMDGSIIIPEMCGDSLWTRNLTETGQVTFTFHYVEIGERPYCEFEFKHDSEEMKTLEIRNENGLDTNCGYQSISVYPESFTSERQPKPLKRFRCSDVKGTVLVELPTSSFVVMFVPYLSGLASNNSFVTFTLKPCVSCRQLTPKMDIYTLKKPPAVCSTRSCLSRDSRKYVLVMDSFDKFDMILKGISTCSLSFVLKNPPSVCISLSSFKHYHYIGLNCDDIYVQLFLDSELYMTLSCTTGFDDWCFPEEWIRDKSDLNINFEGLADELFYKVTMEIQTNTSSTRYKDCPAYFPKLTTTTTRTDYPDHDWPSSDQTSNTDSVVMGPVVGIISFSAFVIGVCCFAAYVRSKSNARHQRRGRLAQHAAYFTTVRNVQNAASSLNPELGPNPAGQHPTISYRPPEMDLPPPYPGKSAPEAPPPSYEDACVIISTDPSNVPQDK